MSKSFKKPIYKDNGSAKSTYHKVIRSSVNQALREAKKLVEIEDLILPEAKELINDYDYRDYTSDYRFEEDDDEWKIKLARK
jgi:ribosomal protein L7/L12